MMLRLLVLVALNLGAFMAVAAEAEAPIVKRFGVYVVSDNLETATAFYRQVFAKEPQLSTPGMVAFDVDGGLYAIVSQTQYAPNVDRGDNVVPYIKVANIFGVFEHVKSVAPASLMTPAVVDEGAFKFFRFVDPDGNVIEFFSVEQP